MIERLLVSILTPSFNQARWLSDTLRSVSEQTYGNTEHVVMDGGSTDGSIGILAHAGPKVVWRSEPDRGQSHALNKALGASRGQIIGWLNSDDAYFDREAIARAVEAFRTHPDIDVIYGHAALVNAAGLILQAIWVPPFSYRLLRLHNFIIQPAAFIRRNALAAWIADEQLLSSMDRELWLRLGLTRRFLRLDKILAIDRHYPGRKGMARPDLVADDLAKLKVRYGVRSGNVYRAQLKVMKIVFRLLGARLLAQCRSASLAFDGRSDSSIKLACRQVAMPRASMPIAQQATRVSPQKAGSNRA